MSRYRVAVHIVPRRGLLDPQGKAVADALHSLGFTDVRDVRVGRHLVIDADAPEAKTAERVVRDFEHDARLRLRLDGMHGPVDAPGATQHEGERNREPGR